MKTGNSLILRQSQGLALTQSLREAIALLHYNSLELDLHIARMIAENPLLELADEVADPGESVTARLADIGLHHALPMENQAENVPQQKTLRTHLLDQTLLCGFSERKQLIAEALIDSLDEKGYLTVSPAEVASMSGLPVTEDEVNAVLEVVRTFEPRGIAADCLATCLLLQVADVAVQAGISADVCRVAEDILQNHFEAFLAGKLQLREVREEILLAAVQLIGLLDRAPGLRYHDDNCRLQEEPELYLLAGKTGYQVHLRESYATSVRINREYANIIKTSRQTENLRQMRDALSEARFFLSGIKKRNETLLRVGQYLVDQQQAFIIHGLEAMKPMTLADVAAALELHESTVSRVTSGKYIATPHGVFELKFFFSSKIASTLSSAMASSSVSVKSMIRKIIKCENINQNPALSDGEIAASLRAQGVAIARRTVAKYREALGIPSCHQRMKAAEFKFSHALPKKGV